MGEKVKKATEIGRWEVLNVLGAGVFVAAVPVLSYALYQLGQRGSCGGRLQPECDNTTTMLMFVGIFSTFLVLGLGQWFISHYHQVFRRRIPAQRFLVTYVSVFSVLLCVGIVATRDSFLPKVIFTVIAIALASGELIRYLRVPGWRNPALLLRAADVPAGDNKRQEKAKPWTGALTGYEIAYYAAMALGTLAAAGAIGLLL